MGHIIVITGATGAGKSTIARELVKRIEHAGHITRTTSRQARPKDTPGEYRSIDLEKFRIAARKDLKFVHWNHGVGYGISPSVIEETIADPHKIGILILPPRLVKELHSYTGIRHYLRYVSLFFIVPPEGDAMKKRLQAKNLPPGFCAQYIQEQEEYQKDAQKSGLPYTFIQNTSEDVDDAVRQIERLISNRVISEAS